MSRINFFHGLLESLISKKIVKPSFNFLFEKKKESSLEDLIENIANAKGEVSALNYAEDLLNFLDRNNKKILIKFFFIMLNNFDLDINNLNDAIKNYNTINKNEVYLKITKFSEPKRLDIFRRLNAAPRGTIRLVNLRKRLLRLLKKHPEFKIIDYDLANLFKIRGSGTLIGISSVAGDRGRASNYIYGSSKAGVSAFLSGLRNRLYPFGIHVLTVKPGFVQTKMTSHINLPKKLTTNPEKVANSIYYAYKSRKNIIYVMPIWKYIMLFIKLIPESFFKKMKL